MRSYNDLQYVATKLGKTTPPPGLPPANAPYYLAPVNNTYQQIPFIPLNRIDFTSDSTGFVPGYGDPPYMPPRGERSQRGRGRGF